MRKIYIGTSGWNYGHWKGIFYPADCPMSKRLEFYTGQFTTVELNATFYRLFNPKTVENCHEKTPGWFLWSVKASRYITHIKRLKDFRESLKRFMNSLAPLKEKLGIVLFQLPPKLVFDGDVFEKYCKGLKKGCRTPSRHGIPAG